MKTATIVALTLFFLLSVAPVEGALVNYNFPIDGSQQVPPVVTAASGTGLVTLDTVTNQLDWNITFSGLITPEIAAHFHGPAPVGVNAGVQISLALGSPKIGSQIITAAQEADVLAGLWYVNIHSQTFPGGEIRGQVVPEPMTVMLLGLGGLALLRKRRA